MATRTTIRLPDDLLRQAKRKAAAEGRTLTSLIEDGLRSEISRKHTAPKRERTLPRFSTATGGMQPGMENLTYSQLEELDDLEYIKRLQDGFK